ncbi:MAG: hypothetical protein VKI82_04830 [Leptolyngbya sp.]|nr:hypothetical protein [Leptolyngbya sp.]
MRAIAWIVDPRDESITVFYPDAPPQTYVGDQVIEDDHLEGLRLQVQAIF